MPKRPWSGLVIKPARVVAPEPIQDVAPAPSSLDLGVALAESSPATTTAVALDALLDRWGQERLDAGLLSRSQLGVLLERERNDATDVVPLVVGGNDDQCLHASYHCTRDAAGAPASAQDAPGPGAPPRRRWSHPRPTTPRSPS